MAEIDFEELAGKLQRRGFIPHIAETKEELSGIIINLVGNESVGFGGSSGISSLGIYEALEAKGNAVFWHWKESEKAEKIASRRKAANAEWYLCTANALTVGGQIIEIDGFGNRVGAMIYGPKKLIVVAAKNKIAKDIESGISQIKKNICPGNAKRQNFRTPCAITGNCGNCLGGDSMCRVTAVFDQPTRNVKEFHLILFKESLGL